MTVAFICSLELEPSDLSDLENVQIEIQNALELASFEVASVHAWAGEGRATTGPAPSARPVLPFTPPDSSVPTLLPERPAGF